MPTLLKRIFLFILSVIFIIEAWLWETTGALVSRLVGWIPFDHIKRVITARVEHLSPYATLGVFVIPAIVLLPLKFIAVWLFTKGHLLGGMSMVLLSKLMGFGVASFLFTLCKPKLMQLRAIRWVYEHCIRARSYAANLVAPYMARIRASVAMLRSYLPRAKWLELWRAHRHKARKSREP